jgi:hypothetical protein
MELFLLVLCRNDFLMLSIGSIFHKSVFQGWLIRQLLKGEFKAMICWCFYHFKKIPAALNNIEVSFAIEHIKFGECFSSIALAMVTYLNIFD